MKSHTYSSAKTRALMIGIVLVGLGLAGCETVKPNHIRVGVEHLSSVTQHFGSNPTDFGFNAGTISAEWEPTKHTYVEVQEAYIIGNNAKFSGGNGHEYFEARAGVQFNLK